MSGFLPTSSLSSLAFSSLSRALSCSTALATVAAVAAPKPPYAALRSAACSSPERAGDICLPRRGFDDALAECDDAWGGLKAERAGGGGR